MNKQIALSISDLTVNYGTQPVLWDISFQIPVGTLNAFIGPNGAGKSTLMKAALGLIRPVTGNVLFFSSPLKHLRHKIAYVPQRESVDWDFPVTVFDLVAMGLYGKLGLWKRVGKKEKSIVYRYLEMVGMGAFGSRQISQLSGGQQQRAFIARALIQEADLYLMDEPFSGIDIASTQEILYLLLSLKQQGKTVCVVHHDLNTVKTYFDNAVLLHTRLIANGSVKEVLTNENIKRAYGAEQLLLDEALQMTTAAIQGLKP